MKVEQFGISVFHQSVCNYLAKAWAGALLSSYVEGRYINSIDP